MLLYVAEFSSLYSAALHECLSCGACIFLCPGPAHLSLLLRETAERKSGRTLVLTALPARAVLSVFVYLI